MTENITEGAQTNRPVIYRNGSVYSPTDPFATALLVKDGLVLWVGQEAGADSLTDEHVETVDLDGLLLAPGFVGWAPRRLAPETVTRLIRAGYTGLVEEPEGHPVFSALAPGAEVRKVLPDVRPLRGASGLGEEAPLPEDVPGVLVEVEAHATDVWVDVAHEALTAGRPAGVVGEVTDADIPNPWRLTAAALRLGSERPGMSTRGCFGLQTRGVRRLFAAGGPFGGQIVPDAPADFVGWRAEALMVQTADQRIAAWSTDPRARTPLLPELGGQDLPTAHLSVIGENLTRW